MGKNKVLVNEDIVSRYLEEIHQYPKIDIEKCGMTFSLIHGDLVIQGTPDDYIDFADLLVSLALSGENIGQHFHVNSLTLLDEKSEIQEVVLELKK